MLESVKESCYVSNETLQVSSGGSKGGEHRAHSPPLELSNALLLGRGLAVATYISLTSHLLPPESRLLASYTRTDRSCANNIMWPHPPLFYSQDVPPPSENPESAPGEVPLKSIKMIFSPVH